MVFFFFFSFTLTSSVCFGGIDSGMNMRVKSPRRNVCCFVGFLFDVESIPSSLTRVPDSKKNGGHKNLKLKPIKFWAEQLLAVFFCLCGCKDEASRKLPAPLEVCENSQQRQSTTSANIQSYRNFGTGSCLPHSNPMST